MTASTTFTAQLWRSIAPIYAAILRHPFVRGLTDGSLSRDAFRFYAVQDALYLREFARALSVAAARAPRDDWAVAGKARSTGAKRASRNMKDMFRLCDRLGKDGFSGCGVPDGAVRSAPAVVHRRHRAVHGRRARRAGLIVVAATAARDRRRGRCQKSNPLHACAPGAG